MSKATPSVDDLRTFMLVARLGSFSRVAEQLETAASSISTAVGRLEAQLGARLFQRTTRKVVLTQEGKELLGRSERLLEDYDELAGLFRQGESRLTGRLRVDLPLGMASGIVMKLLPGFMARHPDLSVDVFSTDRRVDVIGDGYDCVVRAGPVVDETLACRPLGRLPLVNVASRAYLDTFGMPRSLADLAGHHLVNYQPNPSGAPAAFEYMEGQTTRMLPMRHRITVNNSAAYGAACRAGFGIVQVPRVGVEAELAAGDLIQVLPDCQPPPMPVNLLYPHRRNVPQRVRLFGDWLAEIMAADLGTAGSNAVVQ
jgi:DNA-binding transcriptional LysR family regulator